MKMGKASGPLGTAVAIEALRDDARALDLEAFEAKHGRGFLMVTASGLAVPGATQSTRLLLDGIDADPAGRTAKLSVVLYPMRQRHGPGGHLVTIGRDAKHDVVIPDPTISRFHAFAKGSEDGTFLLQDAGSSNGTTVNGKSVPAREAGPAVQLKPGDTVVLGQVELTFSDARATKDFAAESR